MRGRIETKLYPDAIVYGPYFHSAQQRWYVQVVWSGIKTFLLLSRFKMQEHLGQLLNEDQDVDHKDGNPRNDDIDNLQVLTVAEHNRKTHLKYDDTKDVLCAFCNTIFTMTKDQQYRRNTVKAKNMAGPFCSIGCSNSDRACR